MMTASRVAIIVGESSYPRLLTCFKPLFQSHESTAFMLNQAHLVANLPDWVQVKLYESVVEFSGYMRGLEADLRDFDLVIACEAYQLSTLQALRAAKSRQKPFYVYITQENPLYYEGLNNVNAIQHEVLAQADGFIVPTRHLYQMLRQFSVPAVKLMMIPPVVDQGVFCPLPNKRQKFRQYLRLENKDRVILFKDALERHTQPDMVIKALRFLMGTSLKKQATHLKVIFAGSGDYAQELKYLAYNLGVGNKTYFLHQDPEPFLVDLYNASDFIVYPARKRNTTCIKPFPYFVLEAMSCGATPLVAAASMAAELVGDEERVFHGDHYEKLAQAFMQCLGQRQANETTYTKGINRITEHYSFAKVEQKVLQFAMDALGCRRQHRKRIMEEVTAIEGDVSSMASGTILKRIAKVLRKEIPLEHRSTLLCIQGEVYTSLGRFDEAVSSFEDSLQHSEQSGRPYRGLGYVSWHSYSHEEAMLFFRKALALNPNDAHSMMGVGLIYKRIGMIEEAIFWLERSIEVCPDDENLARHALIQACSECQDPELAINVLERAIELVGEDQNIMCAIGQLHVKAGQIDKGNEILRKFLA